MLLVCNLNTKFVKIGQGAYGIVYLFTDKSGHKSVIKVAKDAKEERAKHLVLWSTLPDACKQYFAKPLPIPRSCGTSDNKYGIHAMEYLQGVNMHDYVKYCLAIGDKESVKLVINKLKDAVMCLWRSGFIHMDLHMRNVIITHKNIKIIDFGLSERVTPLKTPKTKKDVIVWFTEKYQKSLDKLGFNATNPNLYAYGIKKHKMYYKPNQKLFNQLHKLSSVK